MESREEVEALRAALHGRTIKVGIVIVSVQVRNDLVDSQLDGLAGNCQWGQ